MNFASHSAHTQYSVFSIQHSIECRFICLQYNFQVCAFSFDFIWIHLTVSFPNAILYHVPIFLCSLRSTSSIGLYSIYAMRYTLPTLNWFADTLHCFHSFNQFTSLIEFTTILYAMLTKHHTHWCLLIVHTRNVMIMKMNEILCYNQSFLFHFRSLCVTMIELFGKIFLSMHWLPSYDIHSILKYEIDAAVLTADAFWVPYEFRI